jgi:hypothetical protein
MKISLLKNQFFFKNKLIFFLVERIAISKIRIPFQISEIKNMC